MDKRIFKKCKILGAYWEMSVPYVKYPDKFYNFCKEHMVELDNEGTMYSTIFNDRKELGGDIKIHKIKEYECGEQR